MVLGVLRDLFDGRPSFPASLGPNSSKKALRTILDETITV
jgi:hypothetical protein